MIKSMTGFASRTSSAHGWSWTWDLRAVNARGLDLRLRLPDWIDGLEQELRKALKSALARGSVAVSLKLQRDGGSGALAFSETALDTVLAAIRQIEDRALSAHDLELAATSAADLLSLRALSESGIDDTETAPLRASLVADFGTLLERFDEMRRAEGAALAEVLSAQIAEIESLTGKATQAAESRREKTAQTLRENLARILDNTEGADPDRVAQELALIAVKTDVTEELDRLQAHVVAARDLLAADGPVGRKLDFLAQEFNREANTLCSKAQSSDLTRIGLDLKAAIEQMREQVQNVE